MVLVMVWTTATALFDRQEAMRQAEIRAQTIADLAGEHVLRTVEGADTALRAARPLYKRIADWDKLANDRAAWQTLREIGESLAVFPTMFLVDSKGFIRLHANTFPLAPISTADRPYFQHQKVQTEDKAYVGEPIIGRVTGRPVIVISRRLTAPDGKFGGLVCATLVSDAFGDFFHTLSVGEGSIITLQRDDGLILVRHPSLEGAVGSVVDNTKSFPAIAEGKGNGAAITTSPLDGVARVTAFRRLDRYGLVMLAAIPVDTVLAPWRRQTLRLTGMVAVGISTLTVLFLLLLRRYRREMAARAQLKTSEATLSRAQRVAHIGSWHVKLPDNEISWSEETYRIYEATPGCVITLDRLMEMIHPDDRRAVTDGLAAALQGAPYEMTHRIVTASGQTRWVEARAQVSFGPSAEPLEIIGTIQDVTEKALAESAIREHQALLLEVQSVAHLGYYAYDIRSDRWQSSPILDEIFGIDESYDRSGAGWLALVAPSKHAEMARYLMEIQDGAHDFDKSYPIIRHNDGEERWVAGLGKIERDAQGKPVRMVGTIKDITEQRRAEQELRDKAEEFVRSNTELEQFAYVASHDLREPLRMVSSYVDLLGRRYGDKLDSDAKEFIAFAKDGATRMDRLILELLEYSRIGRITRPMLPVALGPVVERVLRALATKIEESNAEIATPPAILPTVLGDGEELMRLFQNLIGNAIKYRDPERSPVITMEAEKVGDDWVLT
ncbi:MAG: PAS domain-containing protein, partial [Magnetospirillum sp.]|nr:PAS domain-containing protein [Magnetospirillum sp.]